MRTITIEAFKVVGIKVRTSNEDGKAAQDIPALWERFFAENILDKIPNKVNNEILSIYTNYESDHTKPYDTVLGCKVSSFENLPEGLEMATFDVGTYATFQAKGNLDEGVVYNEWAKIWNTDLKRKYTADFEVYGENAADRTNATVNIFVALQK